MSKRTLFLIFALFVITSVLLVIALYNPNSKPQPPQIITAPKEPVAQTTLLFGRPAVATSSSSSTLSYSIPINITTGKNKVTAVQLEMQYDPKILLNIAVVPGPFFTKPEVLLNQIDSETGRISYAFGVGLTDPGIIGNGVVATLTFDVRAGVLQQTGILFLPKTLVTADGVTESVLKETNAAQLTVGKQ